MSLGGLLPERQVVLSAEKPRVKTLADRRVIGVNRLIARPPPFNYYIGRKLSSRTHANADGSTPSRGDGSLCRPAYGIAPGMREFIYFFASSAVAAVLTAAAVVIPVPAFWGRVLWVSAALVVLCAVGAIVRVGLTTWRSRAKPAALQPQKQQSPSVPTSETQPAPSSFMSLHAANGGRISGIHIDGLKQHENSRLIDARAEGGGSITNVVAKNIDQTSSPKPDDASRRR